MFGALIKVNIVRKGLRRAKYFDHTLTIKHLETIQGLFHHRLKVIHDSLDHRREEKPSFSLNLRENKIRSA